MSWSWFYWKASTQKDKGVTFKNCALFTKCIIRINNTATDNAQDIDIVMAIYNLIEYSDHYSKTFGSLWQWYKDEANDNIVDSESSKSKRIIKGKTPTDRNRKNAAIIVPFKYLSNFWRTLEMPLINCEVDVILTSSKDCVTTKSTVEKI